MAGIAAKLDGALSRGPGDSSGCDTGHRARRRKRDRAFGKAVFSRRGAESAETIWNGVSRRPEPLDTLVARASSHPLPCPLPQGRGRLWEFSPSTERALWKTSLSIGGLRTAVGSCAGRLAERRSRGERPEGSGSGWPAPGIATGMSRRPAHPRERIKAKPRSPEQNPSAHHGVVPGSRSHRRHRPAPAPGG